MRYNTYTLNTMKTRIYYFSADFDFGQRTPESYTEQELRLIMGTPRGGIELYSLQDFETAFNQEYISDLGHIRIFTDK